MKPTQTINPDWFVPQERKAASTVRRIGRPRNGRAVFSQERVDTLPELGCSDDVIRSLGIALGSLQGWRRHKSNPVPFRMDERGRAVFERLPLIRWLIQTRRFKPTPEVIVKYKRQWRERYERRKKPA